MANYILMVQLEVAEEHVDEFNRLYDGEHVPSLLSVDGVVSGQRYELDRNGDDQLRFLAIYEIERPEIPESDEWQRAITCTSARARAPECRENSPGGAGTASSR